MIRMAERKALRVAFKQGGPEGSFTATFARFGVVDLDGDVTLPGAFEIGAKVRLTQFGHNWQVPTVGTGTIGADRTRAWIDGQFNLRTTAGRDHYESVKDAGELQQFSYGYDAVDTSTDPAELAMYPGAKRILKKIIVHEVSPVMLGAGDTGLDSIKAAKVVDGIAAKAARAVAYTESTRLHKEFEREWDDDYPGRVTYYEVAADRVAAVIRDAVPGLLAKACAALGIDPPTAVRFFERATDGAKIREAEAAVEIGIPMPVWGRFPAGKNLVAKTHVLADEIWLRSDLNITELPRAIAHEAAHLAGPDAADLAAEGAIGARKSAYYEVLANGFEEWFASTTRPPRPVEPDPDATRRKAADDRVFRGSFGGDLHERAEARRAWLARNGRSA